MIERHDKRNLQQTSGVRGVAWTLADEMLRKTIKQIQSINIGIVQLNLRRVRARMFSFYVRDESVLVCLYNLLRFLAFRRLFFGFLGI